MDQRHPSNTQSLLCVNRGSQSIKNESKENNNAPFNYIISILFEMSVLLNAVPICGNTLKAFAFVLIYFCSDVRFLNNR